MLYCSTISPVWSIHGCMYSLCDNLQCCILVIYALFFFFFFFLGPHLKHMEVPRPGVQSELQMLAYATATPDWSLICDPHHSSQQHQIFNPLNESRDPTSVHMVTSQVCYHCTTTGTPFPFIYIYIHTHTHYSVTDVKNDKKF